MKVKVKVIRNFFDLRGRLVKMGDTLDVIQSFCDDNISLVRKKDSQVFISNKKVLSRHTDIISSGE